VITNRTKKYLDTVEAAAYLGKQPATLVVWRCTKRYPLPYLKIGGAVRYEESDLIAFLESRKVSASMLKAGAR
jgi:predicted DNA-binding transcriptional regulator AlpA